MKYSVVQGRAIFNGCIELGSVSTVEEHAEQVRALAAVGQEVGVEGIGLPADSAFLWPNGVVPFVVDGGLPNQTRTTQANCVRFVSNGDANFSSSPIGMRGGEQQIKISNGATMGTVVHECLHSLGVLHEQSRCDRDSHVKIHYENIQAGFESNFDKFCDGFVDYYDYDYGSIMHYPATAFGDGKVTIEVLTPGVTIGQRAGLSFGDRLTISNMYRRFFVSGHHGVWRSGTGGYGLWVNANWDSFKAKWTEWAGQGLRLVDIEVRQVGNEARYSGVWRPGTGGYGLWVNASWDSFKAKWTEWAGQGLRLVDIQMHQVGNGITYSGVWLPGNQGYGLWANASWDGFLAKWKEWSAQGLRLVDMDVKQVNGDNRYSGVFLAGNDGYYLWGNATWENFRAKWEQLAGQGLRLIDYEFAVSATADADVLTGAGIPASLVDGESDGSGAGGLFGFDAADLSPEADGEAVLTAVEAVEASVGMGDGGAVLVAVVPAENGQAAGVGEASFG